MAIRSASISSRISAILSSIASARRDGNSSASWMPMAWVSCPPRPRFGARCGSWWLTELPGEVRAEERREREERRDEQQAATEEDGEQRSGQTAARGVWRAFGVMPAVGGTTSPVAEFVISRSQMNEDRHLG
jgi:hypothetical protein